MAFTLEEIEKAFTTPLGDSQRGYIQLPNVKESVNYPLIIDYLTGQTSTLQIIQNDGKLHGLGAVMNLLRSIEFLSTNDQLVLDVIHHPDVWHFTKYFFFRWLLDYTFEHPEEKSFQAVMSQLRHVNLNDDAIFTLYISSLATDNYSLSAIAQTPLKEFLVTHVKKNNKIIYPSQNAYFWYSGWNSFYFMLLEEVKPDLSTQYALHGLFSSTNQVVSFLSTYKEGKYVPFILSSLADKSGSDSETIQSKFSVAISLYEENPSTHEKLVTDLSRQYLEHFAQYLRKEKWEPGYHLNEFKGKEFSYTPFSTCAFHFLFKKDKNSALVILKDLFEKKVYVNYKTLQVAHYHIGTDVLPYLQLALKADTGGTDYFRDVIGLLQSEFKPAQYLSFIWQITGNKSRAVKELVARIIAEHDTEAEPKAIELLKHKNAESRQTAALILTQFSSYNAINAIKSILDKEANDNARDILLQVAALSLPTDGDKHFVESMVDAAAERDKLDKPIVTWLSEEEFPPLYAKDGTVFPHRYTRFLLYRMSRVKTMRSDIEAKYIIQLIDKEKSAPFAAALIKTYIDKEAKPEYKFLMAVAALMGNDSIVDKIRTTTNKWIDENRYKMAEHGVGALALQGSNKALRWVEWYSRKYKSKKANVGTAALEALEAAAEELAITTHELGDRIIPDFGFEGLFRHFSINGEVYRAFIDSNFKIAFFNDDNKKFKSLPPSASIELKEEFKTIGKEIRDIVRSQSSRLEYYLIIQRRWDVEQWKNFFLGNPVMFIYATKLLWGMYDENGQLTQTFLCNEDTSLINEDNDEISIQKSAFIGIVHPTQLDKTLLQKWKQQFFDLSIEPIFPQLERSIPDMSGIDLGKAIIKKFDGRKAVAGSIKSTLERYGWHKGPTGDGGFLESFNLLYFEKKMEAVLELEGVGAGYGWGTEEKLGRLYVIDKSKETRRWFNRPQNDADERLIKLKDVPIIFLTEMLTAIETIKPVEK